MMQVVEYFRAFLVARIGWDRINSLIVISGAFGLFSRSHVEAVGGWAHGTVGEDVELVTRLHGHLRKNGEPFEVSFVPDPVCWTEAPETISGLARQRRRWQRGLAETLWRHKHMICNPRYGALGMIALPYFVAFELLGVLFEALGLVISLVVFILGAFSLVAFVSFLAVSILVSMLVSAGSVVLEEYVVHRNQRRNDIARLVLYASLESFGYRQLNAYWRFRGLIDVSLRKSGWGEQQRRGLERGAEVPLPREGEAA
jgi:cellulose synthase/poly-beta-1,6-N-acetylglucosamine synthase-like glycosyltransferase